MSKRVILVTGGAGFIGSHTLVQLEKVKHEVIVLDNLSNGFKEAVTYGSLMEGDIGDLELVEKIIKANHVTDLIHFAAFIDVAESVEYPEKYNENNFLKAKDLFQKACDLEVENIIFSSTAAVYGENGQSEQSETSKTIPASPYGESKLKSEKFLLELCERSSLKGVVLRYFNVGGACMERDLGQNSKGFVHLIKVAMEAAAGKRDKIVIFGDDYDTRDGSCERDFIHVDDLASAHVSALNYLLNNGESGIFNVGYGQGHSVKEVIERVKKVTGKEFKVEVGPRREGDISSVIANNSKIQSSFDWTPKYNNLDTIIRSAWEYEHKKN